jgi:AcrR family transcriptional regulator
MILPKENLQTRTGSAPNKRRRRSTEEIIDRLMEAACEEFERNGYTGTKTATIARKAGVAEALIFSNFGSKAKLFHDAIFKPLNQQFLDFRATHPADAGDPAAMRAGTREYIEQLQAFIRRHSGMLMSLVVAQMYASEDVEGLSRVDGLHDFFARASALAMKRLDGRARIDPRLIARVSFATILACIIFKDWLFPEGLASDRAIGAAITDFVMDGLSANATPAPTAARRASRADGTKGRRKAAATETT